MIDERNWNPHDDVSMAIAYMFSRLVAQSAHRPDEILAALASDTTRERLFRRPRTTFVGTVSGDGFRVRRWLRRDALNPMFYGRVAPLKTGTEVRALLTLTPSWWTWLSAWSLGWGFELVRGPITWVSVITLLAPWIAALGYFQSAAEKSRGALEQCLQVHFTPASRYQA